MVSPLEPIHPDGRLDRVAVVGAGCPPALAPPAAPSSGSELDGIVLAPSAADWRASGRLLEDFRATADDLRRDGLVYAVGSPRRRRALRRMLNREGFRVTTSLLHVPDLQTSRYLVPIERGAGRYALSHLIPVWPRRRWIFAALLRSGLGRALIEWAAPGVALVARSSGERPLYGWLDGVGVPEVPDAVLTTRRGRSLDDRLVLSVFSRGSSMPSCVVKLADGIDSNVEAELLERLGEGARMAGAGVPSLLAARRLGSRSILVETSLAGRIAADVLVKRPGSFPGTLDQLAGWLERWNAATRSWIEPAWPVLERELLEPLRTLEPIVGRTYSDWIVECCSRVGDSRVRVVAAHNDLTMFNVLLGNGDVLSIVDWEAAQEHVLPLGDLSYAAVDAVCATSAYRDRPAAFDAVYAPGGVHAERVRRLTKRLSSGLDLTSEAADLAFHACWLSHASNEVREHGLESNGPFAEIARRLVRLGASR